MRMSHGDAAPWPPAAHEDTARGTAARIGRPRGAQPRGRRAARAVERRRVTRARGRCGARMSDGTAPRVWAMGTDGDRCIRRKGGEESLSLFLSLCLSVSLSDVSLSLSLSLSVSVSVSLSLCLSSPPSPGPHGGSRTRRCRSPNNNNSNNNSNITWLYHNNNTTWASWGLENSTMPQPFDRPSPPAPGAYVAREAGGGGRSIAEAGRWVGGSLRADRSRGGRVEERWMERAGGKGLG